MPQLLGPQTPRGLLFRCAYFVILTPRTSGELAQTAESYLVLVTLEYIPDDAVYQSPPLGASARGKYLAGPGEGFPLQAINLRFEGVVRVEGNLLWCVRQSHIYPVKTLSSTPAYRHADNTYCSQRKARPLFSAFRGPRTTTRTRNTRQREKPGQVTILGLWMIRNSRGWWNRTVSTQIVPNYLFVF